VPDIFFIFYKDEIMIRKISTMIVVSLCLLNSAYANPFFKASYWNPNTAPFRTDSFYVGAGVGSSALDYHTTILQPNPIIDSKFYGSGAGKHPGRLSG
jgi:hypothetical protein